MAQLEVSMTKCSARNSALASSTATNHGQFCIHSSTDVNMKRLLFLLCTALEISSEYPWKVIPMTGNNVTEKSPIKNGTLPRTVDMWSHHQNDSSISKKLNGVDKRSQSDIEEQILKDAMSKPEYPKNNPKIPEGSSSKSDGPDHEPDRSNDSSSASSVTKSVDSGRYKLLYIQLCQT